MTKLLHESPNRPNNDVIFLFLSLWFQPVWCEFQYSRHKWCHLVQETNILLVVESIQQHQTITKARGDSLAAELCA